jgi:hypothetical protein
MVRRKGEGRQEGEEGERGLRGRGRRQEGGTRI